MLSKYCIIQNQYSDYHMSFQDYSHYSDVLMIAMASQITGVSIVYSIVCSVADQRKHQSFASLAFLKGFTGDWWIPRTEGQ